MALSGKWAEKVMHSSKDFDCGVLSIIDEWPASIISNSIDCGV